ncbi:hypothetical protein [Mucilaginibacter flavus]|uniref:hypothetical protein n=1 Tax=Mucilaginibacter flavus TaxID=931504 RepID=UPI0025B5BA5E|nr:hypothetical protein [Mucilaginibacter flavus]MDN3580008.1 hypothetical protein [Mucilaginibacter flavus]
MSLSPAAITKVIVVLFFVTFVNNIGFAQQSQVYPRVMGYFSVTNAVETWTKDGFTGNFKNAYTVSFPFGINLLKSDHFGVSFEVAPVIRTEKNIAKVNSISFNPGAMFRFKNGFTFIGRTGFETNGRFGFSPVFNQRLIQGKDANLFIAASFPIRFGNNFPASIGSGIQLGVSF